MRSQRIPVVTILSGGLDSAVATSMFIDGPYSEDYEVVHAVSFWYGQRHNRELLAAQNICEWWTLPHTLVNLDSRPFGQESALMFGSDNAPPEDRTFDEMGVVGAAPTFVPGRNLIFIAQSAALAYTLGVNDIIGGWHWDDSSGYPDCREEFLVSAKESVSLALDRQEFQLHYPLIKWSKGMIVEVGKTFAAPLELTWSCYNGGEKACGRCDTCRLRLKGFQDAGFQDEIPYEYVPDDLKEAVWQPESQ